MDTSDAFFLPDGTSDLGQAFLATDHTRGPWDPGAQHGGPPSALLAHVLESAQPRTDAQFVRLTNEILRPVPVGRLHVATEVLRGGKKVEHLAARMHTDDGTLVMTATAWRIRTAPVVLTNGIEGDRVPGPDQATPSRSFFKEVSPGGYVGAMETRFASGGWADPGPAVAWMRMRHPLLPGVDPSPLVRVMIAADSGNGVSARFEGLFINPDLTVYLTRPPVGEWVCLQAHTILTNHGIGLAQTVIHDTEGPVGSGAQSLLLDEPGT
ncbi:MAG TPA: thioesterase family protein [Euzebya sp.]|nr:thioesterase family protein [Euzebya sp.]